MLEAVGWLLNINRMGRRNYYSEYMSDNYEKLEKLLDDGNVVICFVNYEYRTGGRDILYRDVAKARNNDYQIFSQNYGYIIEARGIVYGSWDRNMFKLRGKKFSDECERLGLQFIDFEL